MTLDIQVVECLGSCQQPLESTVGGVGQDPSVTLRLFRQLGHLALLH